MVSMEAWPTSTSLRSMEQGLLGAAAERAAARGYNIPDDSGSEEEPPMLSRSRAGAESALSPGQ